MKKLFGLIIIALLTWSCSENKKPNQEKEIIGTWVEQSDSHGASITMYRESNHIFLESRYDQ